MKKDFDEVTKFNVITDLKSMDTTGMNADLIVNHIKEEHGVEISRTTFYKWSRNFGIPYKKRSGGKISDVEAAHMKNVKRIKQLTLIVKNLCKELGVKDPDCLTKILNGIEEELQ